jgi:hypothetical protein
MLSKAVEITHDYEIIDVDAEWNGLTPPRA